MEYIGGKEFCVHHLAAAKDVAQAVLLRVFLRQVEQAIYYGFVGF